MATYHENTVQFHVLFKKRRSIIALAKLGKTIRKKRALTILIPRTPRINNAQSSLFQQRMGVIRIIFMALDSQYPPSCWKFLPT